MASNIPDDDWDFHRRVISKNWSQLLKDLDPASTLDAFIETGYITQIQARDISEIPITSEKIRKILDHATKKGPKGYVDFKACLKKSDQEHLVEILENTEKELQKKRKDDLVRKEAERAKKIARHQPFKPQPVSTKRPPLHGDILYSPVRPAVPKESRNIVAYPVQRQVPTERQIVTQGPVGNTVESPVEARRIPYDDDSDTRRVTSADLMNISTDVIGENWELMASFFNVDNETVKQIQRDTPGDSVMQLYKMLLKWKQQLGSEATLQKLEQILNEVPASVYINWETLYDIMRQSSSEERPFEPTGSLPGEDISHGMENLSVSDVSGVMGNTRRQGDDVSNDYQPDMSRGSYQNTPGQQQSGNQATSQASRQQRGNQATSQASRQQRGNQATSQASNQQQRGNQATSQASNQQQRGNQATSQASNQQQRGNQATSQASNQQQRGNQATSQASNQQAASSRNTAGNSHGGGISGDRGHVTGADETDARREANNFSLPAAANVGTDPSDESGDSIAIIRGQLDKLELERRGNKTTGNRGPIDHGSGDMRDSTSAPPGHDRTYRREPTSVNQPVGPDNTDGNPVVPPRCFDNPDEANGRLKTLTEQDIDELQKFCPEKIGEGGYGQVYKTRDKIPGLKIIVVLKKITVENTQEVDKMRSITNEKLASRTMHFAIVPLLGYGSVKEGMERTFYFVTPYMEKGDLAKAIQADNGTSAPVLTMKRRIKILYHVASAIHFLHTPVNKFRRAILHMDLKSLNIVLDQWYNARLIDFGLAREMAEGKRHLDTTQKQIPHSMGYFKTITHGQLDVYADYHNFGVVIRELLTGKKPYDEKEDPEELRKFSDRKLKQEIMPLWKNSENSRFSVTDDLLDLSAKCLEKNTSIRDSNGKLDSKLIFDSIKEPIDDKLHKTWETDRNQKCDMCMQYDAVDDRILEHNKECGMKVCVSCMRHSYCNPIICHSCGEGIVPNIGHGWNAVLIAGNDVTKPSLASVFSKDVEEVKKVITSRCPLVMGISEDHVFTIKPKSPGESEAMKERLTEELKRCLAEDSEAETQTSMMTKTLLLFYSGHYIQDVGFKLGNEKEFITIKELQEHLSNNTADKRFRLIIFLDCCSAPGVHVGDFDKKADVILVQMNACGDGEQSFAENEGSIFQRLFTQALTGRALSSKCSNITRNTNECKECCVPMSKDFVTLYNLHIFIDSHYDSLCVGKTLDKPRVFTHNVEAKDIRIGYVVNFLVDLKFCFELPKGDVTKAIPHSMFSNIEDLRTVLFDEYLKMKLNDSTEEGPPISTTCFRDIIFIFSKDGPKHDHKVELDTIEKVNVAWNARRDLYVSLQTTGTGLVGCFYDNTSLAQVVEYLFSGGTRTTGDENTIEFTTDYDTFLEYLDNHSELQEVATGFNKFHEYKTTFEKKQKVKCSQLRVNFPYDENASPKFRNDFLSFHLLIDEQ